jgi:hypothetical protein
MSVFEAHIGYLCMPGSYETIHSLKISRPDFSQSLVFKKYLIYIVVFIHENKHISVWLLVNKRSTVIWYYHGTLFTSQPYWIQNEAECAPVVYVVQNQNYMFVCAEKHQYTAYRHFRYCHVHRWQMESKS